MSFSVPTAANLKSRFPVFAAVADGVVATAIIEANRRVDDTWTEGDFGIAIMYLAAHLMTLDGLGSGVDAAAILSGASAFKSISSGSLSLTKFDSADVGGGGVGLSGTTYGRRFLDLLRLNKGGPLAVGGAAVYPAGQSPVLISISVPTPPPGVATNKQMRLAIADLGVQAMSDVLNAIDAAPTSVANIIWNSGGQIIPGDALADVIKTALGYSTVQMNGLFASAATKSP